MSSHTAAPSGRLERVLLPAAAAASLLFGYIGSAQYELAHTGHVDHVSALYHALQLLVLHSPHLEHTPPVTLQIGRYLGACFAFLGIAKVVLLALGGDLRALRARLHRGHVVICGLGEFGEQLARDTQHAGKRPVAIESNADAPGAAHARELAIPVIHGSACRAHVLERAAAHRAQEVLLVGGDDETNLEIAFELHTLRLRRGHHTPIEVWCFLDRPETAHALLEHARLQRLAPAFHLRPRAIDLDDERARHALTVLPLRHASFHPPAGQQPVFVVFGQGSLVAPIARQVALLAHLPGAARPRLVIAGPAADASRTEIHARWRNFAKVADVDALPGTPDQVLTELAARCTTSAKAGCLLGAALCLPGGNVANARSAVDLRDATAGADFPILVHLTRSSACAKLLGGAEAGAAHPRLVPFGMREVVSSYAWLCDATQDRLARAFHELYLAQRRLARERNPAEAPRPAEKPWDDLDESFRAGNRALADHLRFKLFPLGYTVVPAAQGDPALLQALAFDPPTLAQQAELEHVRWCAERWLDGWDYATERRDDLKRHPLLVPWADLPPGERWIDEHMVRNARQALQAAGLGLTGTGPR